MIGSFDRMARRLPDAVLFRFIDGDGASETVTYRQARLRAVALLGHLQRVLGLEPGSFVACDMDNAPAFVYLLLACQYGQVTLVTLNHRLSQEEKADRLCSVRQADPRGRCAVLEEADVLEGVSAGAAEEPPETLLHRADSLGGVADRTRAGVVMFTSGTTGRAKAARLSAAQLSGSAASYNRAFRCDGSTRWQAVLPLYHVGGLQVVIRSLLNGTPFLLYRRFDAVRVLQDARTYQVTNISVVDRTLRDLLEAAEAGEAPADRADAADATEGASEHGTTEGDAAAPAAPDAAAADTPSFSAVLRAYRCVLLGGAVPNPVTLEAARAAQVRVFSSYGMTETCSLVAACPIEADGGAALELLPGYQACIMGADENGSGQLGVRGPGVFEGYLNARALFTADGYFLTGDTARIHNGRLLVAERMQDMFVSGGENIYPEAIRRRILGVPGVTDAYVFGAKDARWGRRPVAFVEMAAARVLPQTAAGLARDVQLSLRPRLGKIFRPDRLYVVNGLPRTGIGKVDRASLEDLDAQALDIREVRVHRVRQPFVQPVRTSQALLRGRESLLVEIVDAAGRVGTGEDTAFETDWYLPETIDADQAFLEQQAIPCLLGQAFLQPDAVFGALAALPDAGTHLMAAAALETACWDLYGKITQRTIADLIGARDVWDDPDGGEALPAGYAPGGAVIGLMSVADTVQATKQAAQAGYRRIKLKIAPGADVERVAAVRHALPDCQLMLDANQGYTDEQAHVLAQLDQYGCAGIEEPLAPAAEGEVQGEHAPRELFCRLAALQQRLQTPIFLDESIAVPADAEAALTFPELRGFVLKIGKWGGVLPASDFYWHAREKGARVWMGGMFDTGVSKRLHAAFSLLPGMAIPGDVSDSARYFSQDITTPPLVLEHGSLQVNPPQEPYGVGCALDAARMRDVWVETRRYRRGLLPSVTRAPER